MWRVRTAVVRLSNHSGLFKSGKVDYRNEVRQKLQELMNNGWEVVSVTESASRFSPNETTIYYKKLKEEVENEPAA